MIFSSSATSTLLFRTFHVVARDRAEFTAESLRASRVPARANGRTLQRKSQHTINLGKPISFGPDGKRRCGCHFGCLEITPKFDGCHFDNQSENRSDTRERKDSTALVGRAEQAGGSLGHKNDLDSFAAVLYLLTTASLASLAMVPALASAA
jgi:hypothetical protein